MKKNRGAQSAGRSCAHAVTGLALLAAALILVACAASENKTTTTGTDNKTKAASQVADAKTQLEALAASQQTTTFGQVADVVKLFDAARQLDTTNEEAAFYTGVGELILFADSSTTTSVLNAMSLGSVRYEDARTPPNQFTPPAGNPIILGGDKAVQSYVDLGVADILKYLGTDMAGALAQSASLLNGLGTSFTSTLHLKDINNVLVAREFDYTDAHAFAAMATFMQAMLTVPLIWDSSDADHFISATSTRDASTGADIDVTSQAEIETELQSGSIKAWAGISSAQTKLSGLLSTAFTNLGDSIDSLLGETDDQSNDVITTTPDQPRYDSQEAVNRFQFELISGLAKQFGTSFATTGVTKTMTSYDLVATTRSFAQCNPLTGSTMNTWPNTDQFLTGINPASLLNVASGLMTSTGVIIPSGAVDPNWNGYWFSFTVNSALNMSIRTNESLSQGGSIRGTIYYANSGLLNQWDEDHDTRAGGGNFLMSIDKDYFGASSSGGLPSVPVTFYVLVQGNTPASFNLIVDASTWDIVTFPVYLKGGGGRYFTTALYKRSVVLDFEKLVNFFGNLWDTVDRPSFKLDDPATLTNEAVLNMPFSDLSAGIVGMIPSATVTAATPLGAAISGTSPVNLQQDNIQISSDLDTPPALATAAAGDPAIPSSVTSFCAYPGDFDAYPDVAGGYYRIN